MKILLHTCCAPCVIYPLEQLKKNGFEVTGFFYNPNIHPFAEYKKRKQAVEDFSRKANLEVIFPEYRPAEFFQAVHPVRKNSSGETDSSSGVNTKEDVKERCVLCWSLRLKKTAKTARERGFEFFTTTLLVSPYQDQEALKKIGNDIAREDGIEFYYEDFRPGFKKAHEEARIKGIYCQKYCGCIYSEIEGCRQSGRH